MKPSSRIGALGLTTVLSATCLSMLPATSAQAAGIDPAPANASSAWLRSQLSGNVLRTGVAAEAPVDVEASMDAAIGLQATGDPATAAATTTALASSIAGYVGTEDDTDANAVARAAWFAQTRSQDPITYGGVPGGGLVERLADQIVDAPDVVAPGDGRLVDDTPAVGPDANVVGQAHAAGALGRAADAKANVAVPYLRALQCVPGFLVLNLPATGTTATCDITQQPSVTATATAVIGLQGVAAAQDIRDRAAAWLVTAQQSNGRWTENGGQGPGDAITTGLAGYALALVGRTGPAAQAAVWLRGQQLFNVGSCAGYAAADAGAVALDMASFNAAVAPIGTSGDAVISSFRRATARALAVQAGSPGGPAITDNQITVPRFSKPNRPVTATVRSAPRNVLCATTPRLAATRVTVAYDGTAAFAFTSAPDGPSTASVVDPTGQVDTATVTSLAKKKLRFSFRSKKVRSGKVAVLKVKGLAAGESVKAQFRGKRKSGAAANSKGRATLRFIVTGTRGFVPVRVVGQYPNRNRTKNLVVVRR